MFRLPLADMFANAAAVLSRKRGAPSQRAMSSGQSRQTVYDHARKLQAACSNGIPDPACIERLIAQNAELRREIERLGKELQTAVSIGEEQLKRFAATAEAIGVSIRQSRELLSTLLPKERVPSRSVLDRWTSQVATKATAVLAVLDQVAASKVETAALDEIFFGAFLHSSP